MRFNPPPYWPPAPPGRVPPPGWQPPANWPPAPPGWQFWVQDYVPPVMPPAMAAMPAASGPPAKLSEPVSFLVEAARHGLHPAAASTADVINPGTEAMLDTFRSRQGDEWMDATLSATDTHLQLRALGAYQRQQTGTLDVVIPLAEITGVSVQSAVLSRVIVMDVGQQQIKARCHRAHEVAEQLAGLVAHAQGLS